MLLPASSILCGDGQRRACCGQHAGMHARLDVGAAGRGRGGSCSERGPGAGREPGACVSVRTCRAGGAGLAAALRLSPPGQRLGRSAKRGPAHASAAAPSCMPTRRTMSTSRSVVICRSVLKMLQFHRAHLPRQGCRSWVMAQTRAAAPAQNVGSEVDRACTPRNADMSPRVSASQPGQGAEWPTHARPRQRRNGPYAIIATENKQKGGHVNVCLESIKEWQGWASISVEEKY